jgi:hypothetical protein
MRGFFMVNTSQKFNTKKRFIYSLVFLVLPGGMITLLLSALNCKTENSTIKSNQVVSNLPAVQTEPNKNDAKETTDKDNLSHLDNLPLPSPLDENAKLTPYAPGSLVYHVDKYVADEANSVKQISGESFRETLFNMIDWESNYYKLVIGNMDSIPASPSSLKLIIYSKRFSKLIEHGREGLTEEEKSDIVNQLKNDLAKWKKLWADGQRIRSKVTILHSGTNSSEELMVPLTIRINTAILLTGAYSIEESLPVVIKIVDTIGVDTNWSAVGYACDKILCSLNSKKLNKQQQKIIDEYQAWRSKQDERIFEYEKVVLPSYKSSRRSFERATSLGANEDFSNDKVSIEMPLQYLYITLREDKGYYDPIGISEIQKKVVDFAKAYSKTKSN